MTTTSSSSLSLPAVCGNGTFGFQCKQPCTCDQGDCNPVNGKCTCFQGFMGATCNESK